MVNYDIATVWEFMLCTWPQIRMERLFLQLKDTERFSESLIWNIYCLFIY